jgi:hypothetical protein
MMRDYRCAARKRDANRTPVGCLERTTMRTRPDFMQHEEGSSSAHECRFEFGDVVLRLIPLCSAADAAATVLMQLPANSRRWQATSGPFQLVPEPHVFRTGANVRYQWQGQCRSRNELVQLLAFAPLSLMRITRAIRGCFLTAPC